MKRVMHRNKNGIIFKHCCGCQSWLELSNFGKNHCNWDGLQRNCAECRSLTYTQDRQRILQKQKEYAIKNKGQIQKYKKLYFQRNKTRINDYMNARRKNNVEIRLTVNLRNRIVKALRDNTKGEATIKLLGCTSIELKNYLESKFDVNMSWNNYGSYWHVDHIIPCARFDLSKVSQQRKCFHYSNLRPLEALENLSKGAKLI